MGVVCVRWDAQVDRQVSRGEGVGFARTHGMIFMECSAKNKTGIVQAFDELVQKVLDTPTLLSDAPVSGSPALLSSAPQSSSSCSC